MKKPEIHVNIETLSIPDSVRGGLSERELREEIAREVHMRIANPEQARDRPASTHGRIAQAIVESMERNRTGRE
jgi:hypothetical protein